MNSIEADIIFYLSKLGNFLGNLQFLLFVLICGLITKVYLLQRLIKYSSKFNACAFLLKATMLGTIIEDISWILITLNETKILAFGYPVRIFIIRIAWAFWIFYCQTLVLFLENLIENKFKVSTLQKILIPITSISIATFLYLAFFTSHTTFSSACRSSFEIQTIYYASIFVNFLTLITIFKVFITIRKQDVPNILKTQVKTVIACLVLPKMMTDLVQTLPYKIINMPTFTTNNYIGTSIGTILSSYLAYFCMKKIFQLRFLNLRSSVQNQKLSIIQNFKELLEQLSQASNYKELNHITKNYFRDILKIPSGRVNLYIDLSDEENSNANKFERELTNHFLADAKIIEFLKTQKIIIADEIEFSNFYEKNDIRDKCIKLLRKSRCEIFIPIFNKDALVGYIEVEEEPKMGSHYSNNERDEIIVFVSYLGNIINLIQKRNLDSLLINEKEMREEIYQKHQETNQYKESIRQFFKDQNQKKIGILFFKNGKFSFGNQDARELIEFNINLNEGYKLSTDLKRTALQVLEYKAPQRIISQDLEGKNIVISALPNLEYQNVIVMIFYPDIHDIIKPQIENLKDPSRWDYLLYLETTSHGKLINRLIPSNFEIMLNYKIQLLQAALGKKATFLETHTEDLIAIVEIIHHISLRENLHILKLNSPSNTHDTAIKLFGINPIFGETEEEPLLQKLNGSSTIFIQNIHYLNIEAQEYLAEFIKFGFFRIFKSEQKVSSNVRIICSATQTLNALVSEGKFSEKLFKELNKTSLNMPSLLTLTSDELKNLVSGYASQSVKDTALKTFYELTEKEFNKIFKAKPSSLKELKSKIQLVLKEKSQGSVNIQEEQFDPDFDISDPATAEAARLGKHALKDPKILGHLLNKFKNQNKIATFLGVNRSSVNRRCKEYGLE